MKKIFILLMVLTVLSLVACGDKHEHAYGEWKVSKVATCLAAGEEKRVCSCGEVEVREIAKKEHTVINDEALEPTCTEKGQTAGSHCLVCGEVFEAQEDIDALNHVEVVDAEIAPTCTEKGKTAGSHCDRCGETLIAQEDIDALDHLFENWEEEVAATSTKEGKMVSSCGRADCNETTELKQLMKPVLSLNGDKIVWNAIPNVTGYYLYVNGTLYNVGNVLEYTVSYEEGIYNFAVKAYTSSSDYYPEGKKSDILTITVSDGVNLQQNMGTDFEGYVNYKPIPNGLPMDTFYGNYGAGKVEIIFDENNKYAKLTPLYDGTDSKLTKTCNVNVLRAGSYILEFDIYLGDDVDGNLSFNIFNGNEVDGWLFSEDKVIDLSELSYGEWSTVSVQYELVSDRLGPFANLDLKYVVTSASKNNYILVDNFKIIDTVTNENVDLDTNNGFDLFVPVDKSLSTPDWKKDAIGRDVIYISDKLENELVLDGTNTVLKAYTSNSDHTTFTLAANKDIAQAGIYKLSMKVKLGSAAVVVDNIGFRLSSNIDLGTNDMVFEGLDTLSSDEWVTLEIFFGIGNNFNAEFVNVDFWVFTHNDLVQSANNYVLIDDLAISVVYIQ